ncbi:hypothetical protein NC652_030279 [Populus alba x Populus x berolinensis]|nr:hypothetical protein NC652_030279 [Populus alba x Populus x berolinensis]
MPSVIASRPRVEIGGEDMGDAYTLIMTDPDRCSKPWGSILERTYPLVCTINADSYRTTGKEIVSYETPKPVAGIHRYVFILFKQRPGKANCEATSFKKTVSTLEGFLETMDWACQ